MVRKLGDIKDKPLVSIVIVAYNVSDFIEKCVQSAIEQSYNHIEIIVVDDGSTDGTSAILDELSMLDTRVNVVHQVNNGVSVARNSGIELAKGEFISFIDGDDYIMSDFIEYMLSIYKDTKADLCISLNNFTTNNFNQIKKDNIYVLSSEEAVAELLFPRVRIGVWNKIWRKDFIDKHGFRFLPGQVTGEGLEFMTNAAQYANRVGVGKRKVYCYRLNNINSATTKPNVEKHGIGSLKILDRIENNIDMSSPLIKNAMYYQRWSTASYALRHIIDADEQDKYSELYKELHEYIRRNSSRMFAIKQLPLRTKVVAILRLISPSLTTKISLFLRNRHIRKTSIK